MAKLDGRRTPTLSISLTPELMAAVDARVESGLYTSASEIFREALRLLLEVDHARRAKVAQSSAGEVLAERLASTFELFDFGTAVQAHKLRQAEPGIGDAEIEQRRLAASAAVETDSVIRSAPERLERLRKAAREPK
jgi:putative addiction module CopG family antidote